MEREFVDEATADLRRMVGPGAMFRPHQLEAIHALVEQRRRVLIVQRTGWGKSAVYFVATSMLRRRAAGPTVVVSPLLGLMRNQIAAAARAGIRAASITSDNADAWRTIEDALARDEIDVLLVAPERFANAHFRADILPRIAPRTGLFVIDEVHCISDWGHDFRPDYRRVSRILGLLPRGVPVAATTATANDRVIDDVLHQLGAGVVTIRGTLDRESLALDVIHLPTPAQRLAWLAHNLPRIAGSGIVYTLTVDDAKRVAEWLNLRGMRAHAYYGALDVETKELVEQQLLADELDVLVATSALGMGYDKANLSFVVHFQSPGSPIAYYQQVGRAGRQIARADGVILAGTEDTEIQDWFIRTAFPARPDAEQVLQLMGERADFVPLAEMEALVNVGRSRLLQMLKILEVDDAIEKGTGYRWRRTLTPWTYDEERYEAVTDTRRREQAAMREYRETTTCLMEFLRRALDDPEAAPCGRCARCRIASEFETPPDELVTLAYSFLKGRYLVVAPRKQGIAKDVRVEEGRALAVLGDGGWGRIIQDARAAGRYPGELVTALAELVRRWRPDPFPQWVTCVPSLRSPQAVPDLARRLADALHLPFVPVIAKRRETRPQQEMANTLQQQANIDGAFAVDGSVADGPVLLVDDLVDSRWTVTEIGRLLRSAGSGEVYPLALATAYGE